MENPKIETETQGKTINKVRTTINKQIVDIQEHTLLGTEAGAVSWSIKLLIIKPASTSTGAQVAETSE